MVVLMSYCVWNDLFGVLFVFDAAYVGQVSIQNFETICENLSKLKPCQEDTDRQYFEHFKL